ncbi:hypothetical protein D3C80_1100400 [compost metagenome]
MIVDPGGGQVDHGHARAGPALKVSGVLQRAGDETRRQTELHPVGDGQRLFVVLDADGGGDGPEDLLGVDAHGRVGVDDQGRLDIPAGGLAIQTPAAGDHAPAFGRGDVDVAIGGLALIFADRRTDLGVGIQGVADAQGLHLLGQGRHEAVVDAVLNDQAAGGRAALAGGEEAAVQGDGHGPLQVRVVQHDQRVLAAHLQLHPRLTRDSAGRDPRPHALGAGEADARHILVVDDRLPHPAAADDHVQHAPGQAGFVEDGDQGLGRGRRMAGRLDHHRIAEGQGRRRLPGRDGDGKVPRRDQAEHADRLAISLNLDARPGRGQVLTVQAQGLPGEIFQDAGGAGGLADPFGQGLALLARQQPADGLAPLH